MTSIGLNEIGQAKDNKVCPVCMAQPGHWCNVDGQEANWRMHRARILLVRQDAADAATGATATKGGV